MKLKSIYYIFAVITAMVLYACDLGLFYIESPSFIPKYNKIETLKCRQFESRYIMVIAENEPGGYVCYHYSSKGSDKEMFLALSKKHFDTSYNKTILRENQTSWERYAAASDFLSVDVTAIDDFDLSHKAGSSLNDVVRLIGFSSYPYILSGYKSLYYCNTHNDSEQVVRIAQYYQRCDELKQSEYSPVDKLVRELEPKDLILLGHGTTVPIFFLYFDQLPEQMTKQSFKVSVTTDENQTLTTTVEMDFSTLQNNEG